MAISQSWTAKSEELMKLVDQEIYYTNEKLDLLRLELKNLYKANEKLAASKNEKLEKSVQVGSNDIGTEVVSLTSKSFNDNASNSISSNAGNSPTSIESRCNSKVSFNQIADLDNLIASFTKLYEEQMCYFNARNEENKVVKVTDSQKNNVDINPSSSEQRYLNKLQQMLTKQAKTQAKLNDSIFTQPRDRLQMDSNLKHLIQNNKQHKIYRSIGVETSSIDLNDSNVFLRPEDPFISEETMYLNLPNRLKKVQNKQHIKDASFNSTDIPNLTAMESPVDAIEEVSPCLELTSVNQHEEQNDLSENISFSNANSLRDTTLFHTLVDNVQSNCSTPKRPISTNKSQCGVDSSIHRPAEMSSLFQDSNIKLNASLVDFSRITEIPTGTINTIDLSDLTSMEVSKLDQNLFWKEIFHNGN